MKIIAGQFKGRFLKTPKGSATRPTQGMVREAVFNICQNEIAGARFLDLFAGSGAMGLEAISRGALHATFIEKDRNALSSIRQNIIELEIASQTTIIPADANSAIPKLKDPFQIIYVDPPYEMDAKPLIEKILSQHLLIQNGLLFLEVRFQSNQTPPEFAGLKQISSRRFGDALLHEYR